MILTVGGDMRYAYMTALAKKQSLDIGCIGLESCSFELPHADLSALSKADVILLPNPWRSGMNLPLAQQTFTQQDIFSRMRSNALLLLSDTACMPRLPDGIRWVNLSDDEEYVLKNAHLTAEGALAIAMKRGRYALCDSVCVVIGYGRIAKRLAQLLHALGAKVYAAARREEVRRRIQADGLHSLSTSAQDLARILPFAHYIFSTPPASILDKELLSLISKDALLMDLASPPFGFELSQAHELMLQASRESNLPGRYSPVSAGSTLLGAVRRAIDHQTLIS